MYNKYTHKLVYICMERAWHPNFNGFDMIAVFKKIQKIV